MLSKEITYIDFDGNQRTEVFDFNFTKAELTEMQYSEAGGLEKMIQNIIASQDSARLIKLFKKIVLDSYGVKSLDGKRFIKNETVRDEFAQTQAYSDLFMLLATNDEEAAKFINGIMPKDLAEQAAKSAPAIASVN